MASITPVTGQGCVWDGAQWQPYEFTGAWVPVNAAGGAAPALSASWSAVAGLATVGFRKEAGGTLLRIKGTVRKSSQVNPADVIFTLPAGFRPVENHRVVVGYTASSTQQSEQISVNTDGTVKCQAGDVTANRDWAIDTVVPLT